MQYAIIAAQVVSTVFSLANANQESNAQTRLGQAAQAAAESRALQLTQQAGAERAASQRKAAEERRLERRASSRLQALAAAGGGGALDPSILDLEGDIASEGDFRARAALFEGEDAARNLEFGAALERQGGANAVSAGSFASRSARNRGLISVLGGAANIGSSIGDILKRRGGGGGGGGGGTNTFLEIFG